MLFDFIKKRWFTLALLLILVVAIVRKNLRFEPGDTGAPKPEKSKEKYTEDLAVNKGASLFNLGSESSGKQATLPEIDEATAVAFLQRFGRVAVAEQEKFGFPASVLLACAYVNSFAGRRNCALEANNYLAIRCGSDWNGPSANYTGACFRRYGTAWESIRDFSMTLQKSDWAGSLKKSADGNWKSWVKALAKHRLSDVKNFEKEMTGVIESYRLFELDQ